jgi:hypothetical protein
MARLIDIVPGALALVLASSALSVGCSREAVQKERPAERVTESPVSFVNKVWQADDSSGVAPGTIYVFLSEGTLLITSAREKPMLGTWKQEGGGLTMVEEGLPYKVDVLRLSADEFRIRSNNPGGAVETRLVPASTGSPPM